MVANSKQEPLTMNRFKRWLPGLQILSSYQAAWFARDLMAGLVLATMLVPVGIAYALASGVPEIYGLYATIVPLFAYALWSQPHPGARAGFGSRPRDSRGRAPSLGWRSYTVALASMMAVVSGLVCVLIGVLRLGFVTELLSKRFATDT